MSIIISKRVIGLRKSSLGGIFCNDLHSSPFFSSINTVLPRSFLRTSFPSSARNSAQGFSTFLQTLTLRTHKSDDLDQQLLQKLSPEQLLEWKKADAVARTADAKGKQAVARTAEAEAKGKQADARTAEAQARMPVVASAYAPPCLPQPLSFASCEFDHSLKVADLPDQRGPFFLDKDQLSRIEEHVYDIPDKSLPNLLIFVGTVKSGKSTMLDTVLPGIISAGYQRSAAGGRYPVIFHHTIPAQSTPAQAMDGISKAAQGFAADIGIRLPWKPMGETLRQLALQVEKRNGSLWVLLDEVQEPMLWASSMDGALHFAAEIKSVIGLCAKYGGRVAVTGSSVFDLCLNLASVPTNGFSLWHSALVIPRGQEENKFREIGQCILEFMQGRFPRLEGLDIDRLIDLIKHDEDRTRSWFSQRPALLAYLLSEMGKQCCETELALQTAMHIITDKIRNESSASTVKALQKLDLPNRKFLRSIATGKLTMESLKDFSDTVSSVVRHLFEKASSPTECIWLQPPYGALLCSCIQEGGELVAEPEGKYVRMSHVIRRNLDIIVGLQHITDDNARAAVSQLVSADLVTNERMNGGQAPQDPLDVLNQREFQSLMNGLRSAAELADDQPGSVHAVEKLATDKPKFLKQWGYYFLVLCHNYMSHVLIEKQEIHNVLRLSAVCRVTMIAAEELVKPEHGLAAEGLCVEGGQVFLRKKAGDVPEVATR